MATALAATYRPIGSPTASGKLSSVALLRELEARGAFAYPPLPAAITIDTGVMNPGEAAARISESLGLR